MGKTKKDRRVALVSGVAMVVLLAAIGWVNREEIGAWSLLWREFESLEKNAQGFREYRHRQTGIVFVRLPGGTFNMGSPPAHGVTLSPFLLAKYELSQAEWERVMRSNPSLGFKSENLPVQSISWVDCRAFCTKTGLLLPSEAQWEYACRAGTTTPFAFSETLTKEPANFNSQGLVEVDSFKPNGFGLYNMHGNVWELCEDVYDGKFYSKPEASQKDPLCISGSGHRSGTAPDGRGAYIGFRPAWSLLPD